MDSHASDSDGLLSTLYDELRKLAAQRMAKEAAGQTLQATALVHEAYLRIVGEGQDRRWETQGHFFAAAAEAMRRILVDNARRKRTTKHGGDRTRIDLVEEELATEGDFGDVLAISDALDALVRHDPQAAALVKLRVFAGLKHQEAASLLGLTRRQADNVWVVARAWLYERLSN